MGSRSRVGTREWLVVAAASHQAELTQLSPLPRFAQLRETRNGLADLPPNRILFLNERELLGEGRLRLEAH
jgi:hypothetical protein